MKHQRTVRVVNKRYDATEVVRHTIATRLATVTTLETWGIITGEVTARGLRTFELPKFLAKVIHDYYENKEWKERNNAS